MEHLIGRQKEIKKLKQYAVSKKSEFVAIYGRRRVGKTYLIREIFEGQFAFQVTGLDKANKREQLSQFHAALVEYGPKNKELKAAKDWFGAFRQLTKLLEQKETFKTVTNTRKTIFLTMITTHGITPNQYAYLAQNDLSMDVLFDD